MTKNILVVEDDEDINRLLCTIAEEAGYFVQPAFSGTEAMLYIKDKEWDVILLDLMIPGKSGEQILREIRKMSDVPIIVISAKSEQITKVALLEQGADDYMTKPFDPKEVLARIAVQLRRSRQTNQSNVLTFKDITLDHEAKRVVIQDKEVPLTAREYNILYVLMSNPHKVFTKENIFETVWVEDYFGDENTVNVHMSHLRKKLSEINPEETYIETLWGMGYRLKH